MTLYRAPFGAMACWLRELSPTRADWQNNWRRLLAVALIAVALDDWSVLAQTCVGDCNGNGIVSIDEVITGVNIALDVQKARSSLLPGQHDYAWVLLGKGDGSVAAVKGYAAVGSASVPNCVNCTIHSRC